jgi:hypothetical protein
MMKSETMYLSDGVLWRSVRSKRLKKTSCFPLNAKFTALACCFLATKEYTHVQSRFDSEVMRCKE